MPATASIAPKSAAPHSRSTPASRAPSKATAPPKPAPALPAFARSALPPAPVSGAQPRAAKPRPKIVPIAVKGADHSPGKPLPPHIQSALENSFSVDLGAVRFHSDESAQQTTSTLSARAFTYGSHIFLGPGEHPSDLGLMAHEAAHIVQQQGHSAIQMWSPSRSDTYEREADRASSAVQRGESFTVSERVATPRVQRFPGIHKIRNYLADKAANIPGYTMFTVIVAYDPIRGEDVDRSGANVLRAAVQIIPGGKQITDVLDQYKVFERVAKWMGDQLDKLRDIGQSIIDAVGEFISSLGISDVPHPFRVWERAVDIFTPPVNKILNFIKGLAEGIWQFVRDAILKPLARLAEGKPGWDLLLAVLGHNPITGETVDSGPEAVIGGFMKLIHQEEIWENIKKANAIDRAWVWFKNAVKGLFNLVAQVPGMFIDALKSLEWEDVLLLPRGFAKVVRVFGTFFGKFVDWAGTTIWSLLQIIFEVVAPGAMQYLTKLGASFRTILKDPIGFVGNLIRAAKLGFEQFAAHIVEHLRNAFIKWLTASMPSVYIPKSLDFGEIVRFVLSVLGLTWENIRPKLVRAVGEKAVKAMETGFDLVVALFHEGPAAVWEKIRDFAGNLKDMAMKAIMDYIVVEVVKKAVTTIVALFIPGAGFIKAIVAIWDTISVFLHKLGQMIEIATAFLDSIMEIATGNIAGAAKKVESTLEGLLSLAIAFLAGFLHLGKIPAKIMSIIDTKIRGPVNKAMDKVIDWIADGAKKIGKFFTGKSSSDADGGDVKAAAQDAVTSRIEGATSLAHVEVVLQTIFIELQPRGLKSLSLGPEDAEGEREILAEASPKSRVARLIHKRVTVAISAKVQVEKEPVLSGLLRGPSITRSTRGGDMHWPAETLSFAQFHPEQKDALGGTGRAATLPPVSQPPRTSARKGDQANAGLIIEPEAHSHEIEVLAWNTGQPERGHNVSHAERQFIDWITSRPAAWKKRVTGIQIEVQGRPVCPLCEVDLKALQRSFGNAQVTWTGQKTSEQESDLAVTK